MANVVAESRPPDRRTTQRLLDSDSGLLMDGNYTAFQRHRVALAARAHRSGGGQGVADDGFRMRRCGKERSRQVVIALRPVTKHRALRFWQRSRAGKRYDLALPGTAGLSEKLTVLPVQLSASAEKTTYIRSLRILARILLGSCPGSSGASGQAPSTVAGPAMLIVLLRRRARGCRRRRIGMVAVAANTTGTQAAMDSGGNGLCAE